MKRASLLVLATSLVAAGLPAQDMPPDIVPPAINVSGITENSAFMTERDLKKLPQQTVKTVDGGKPVTFEGVLLADVLAKVGVPTGDKFHSTATSYYLLVEAKDDYRAVFAWAELDPRFMDKAVYVVWGRDGKPLAEKDGPFMLVAPGEKAHGRWVRQVRALTIMRAH